MATFKRVHAGPGPSGHARAGALSEAALDAFEERAGIVEFDGGLPREHAEVLAALCTAPPPAGATAEQVSSVIDAAARFLDRRLGGPYDPPREQLALPNAW
jgi:hypothetical protein